MNNANITINEKIKDKNMNINVIIVKIGFQKNKLM
jgi:hypothetical protein